jgi:hypothetical protein
MVVGVGIGTWLLLTLVSLASSVVFWCDFAACCLGGTYCAVL